MKIRFDYVTNSSSTSFVIISKGKPTEKMFLDAMGIKKGSLLEGLGKDIYYSLTSNMDDVRDAINSDYYEKGKDVKSFLKNNIHPESVAKKAIKALDEGMDVFIGGLSSDGESTESFLCTEALEIDSPTLYINALENGW